MGENVYSYRPGSRVRGVAADVAGPELERIHATRGELTAPAVKEEARPEDAPLHPAFTWDDEQAAELWRTQEAMQLIRAVFVSTGESDEPTPLFVHVTTEDTVGYEPVSAVVRRPDLFAAAMAELQDNLAAARRSVEQLREAAEAAGNLVGKKRADRVAKHLERAESVASG